MAFVPIPKDLTNVKTKDIGNFTTRQAICFGIAGLLAVPTFIFIRPHLSTELATFITMVIAAPFIFLAQYEKDGLTGEQYLKQVYEVKFKRSPIRIYKNTNFYESLDDIAKLEKQFEAKKKKAIEEKSKNKKAKKNEEKEDLVVQEGAD